MIGLRMDEMWNLFHVFLLNAIKLNTNFFGPKIYIVKKIIHSFVTKNETMNKVISKTAGKFLLFFLFSFMQLISWAQDSTSTSNTTIVTKETTTTTEWYTEPWVWIVGGAVLLIILVALLRGNSNKEVSRTTVIKDDRR